MLEESSGQRDGAAKPVPLCSSTSVDDTLPGQTRTSQRPWGPGLTAKARRFLLCSIHGCLPLCSQSPGGTSGLPGCPGAAAAGGGQDRDMLCVGYNRQMKKGLKGQRGDRNLGGRDNGEGSGRQPWPGGAVLLRSLCPVWLPCQEQGERCGPDRGGLSLAGAFQPSSLQMGKLRLRMVSLCWEGGGQGGSAGDGANPITVFGREFSHREGGDCPGHRCWLGAAVKGRKEVTGRAGPGTELGAEEGLLVKLPGFEPWLRYFLALWFQVGCSTSQSLSFPFCKMGITALPASLR